MYKTMLVPIDGSVFSDAAVKEAANLARELHSKIVLFYAAPHQHLSPMSEGLNVHATASERDKAAVETEAHAKQVLQKAASNPALEGIAVEQQFVLSNSAYEAIIEASKKFHCALVVMGSHGRRGLAGVLIGSETQKVLTHSTIPVLVVR